VCVAGLLRAAKIKMKIKNINEFLNFNFKEKNRKIGVGFIFISY
jgi:hypothetical protein